MALLVNGVSISVAQMGADFLLIEPGVSHPPGEATLVLQVDHTERRWQVQLPDGIVQGAARVALALPK